MIAAARKRLHEHINRSIAQRLRRLREEDARRARGNNPKEAK